VLRCGCTRRSLARVKREVRIEQLRSFDTAAIL
jgi:hypothetical protein